MAVTNQLLISGKMPSVQTTVVDTAQWMYSAIPSIDTATLSKHCKGPYTSISKVYQTITAITNSVLNSRSLP